MTFQGGRAGVPSPAEIAQPLIERLRDELSRRVGPIFVALDGRSGAGKTTVSAAVAETLATAGSADPAVTVIEGDLFYAGGSPTTWDALTPVERADRVIDWRRQRDVLTALRNEGVATWHPFDWHSDDWDSEEIPLLSTPIRTVAAPVVILEGAYSSRPELGDLIDLRVLLDPPLSVSRQQLRDREGEGDASDWHARWTASEDHYFGTVATAEHFDLVLDIGRRRRAAEP